MPRRWKDSTAKRSMNILIWKMITFTQWYCWLWVTGMYTKMSLQRRPRFGVILKIFSGLSDPLSRTNCQYIHKILIGILPELQISKSRPREDTIDVVPVKLAGHFGMHQFIFLKMDRHLQIRKKHLLTDAAHQIDSHFST